MPHIIFHQLRMNELVYNQDSYVITLRDYKKTIILVSVFDSFHIYTNTDDAQDNCD